MVLADNEDEKEGVIGGSDVPQPVPRSPLLGSSTPTSDQAYKESTPKEKKHAFFRSWSLRSMGSPAQKFWRLASERDEISRTVLPSSGSHHLTERLRGIFSRKINWKSLQHEMKEWFCNPMNIALFIWIVCVTISGAILFLVMTGMLNKAVPKKSQRDTWFEVNNQILNALFTLMCLYQHPKRFHHLFMLIRWHPEDISRLRKIYCKNGTYKPHEWAHMMVVVTLLHINCFAQYALCGLNVGYRRSERPPVGVAICISVAIAAPAIAGVYTIVSPLGKEYDGPGPIDEESQGTLVSNQHRSKMLKRRLSFSSSEDSKNLVANPSWRGGILDLWEDISIAYLSLFCTFCVFGWNMERLGFGNMYVHIATFILFCTAPYWIFNLAAVNIDNEAVRQGLGLTGAVLCVFGLLYGGYWRIRMRTRFRLPTYTFCCGKPSFSDLTLWIFCCWCSLAQEVRTTNSYYIVDDKFYDKSTNGENIELEGLGLPASGEVRDNRSEPSSPMVMLSCPTSPKWDGGLSPGFASKGRATSVHGLGSIEEESNSEERGTNDKYMRPPPPLLINREGNQ